MRRDTSCSPSSLRGWIRRRNRLITTRDPQNLEEMRPYGRAQSDDHPFFHGRVRHVNMNDWASDFVESHLPLLSPRKPSNGAGGSQVSLAGKNPGSKKLI